MTTCPIEICSADLEGAAPRPALLFSRKVIDWFRTTSPLRILSLSASDSALARRMPNAEKRDLYNCYQNECDKGVSLPRAFKLDHLKPGKLILFQKISTFFILILGARAPISYHPRERKQQEQRMEKRDSPKSG